MFANFLQLLSGRTPPAEYDPFVEDVRVDDRPRRDPRVERMICVCWWLIAVKHVAIIWACHAYPRIPFHQLWVNFPTWLLGVLATVIYYSRTRRR